MGSKVARRLVVAVALVTLAAACDHDGQDDGPGDPEEEAACVISSAGSSWWSVTRGLGLDPGPHWRGVRELNAFAHPPDQPDVLLPGHSICLTDAERELVLAFAVGGPGGGDGGGGASEPVEEVRPDLDDLVPPSLIATDRQSLDPSLDSFIDRSSLLELAWGQVTKRWKAAEVIDVVDKTLVCVYEVDAGSIGIYGGLDPARTVAVGVIIPDRVASVDFALCLARAVVEFSMIGPPDEREPQICGSAYRVETVDGTAYVAYATAGFYETDRDPCEEICVELPGCVDAAKE